MIHILIILISIILIELFLKIKIKEKIIEIINSYKNLVSVYKKLKEYEYPERKILRINFTIFINFCKILLIFLIIFFLIFILDIFFSGLIKYSVSLYGMIEYFVFSLIYFKAKNVFIK